MNDTHLSFEEIIDLTHGELSPGSLADMIAIPFSGKSKGIHSAILEHTGNVSASLIGGRWAVPPT